MNVVCNYKNFYFNESFLHWLQFRMFYFSVEGRGLFIASVDHEPALSNGQLHCGDEIINVNCHI